jgi:hypothetical protein
MRWPLVLGLIASALAGCAAPSTPARSAAAADPAPGPAPYPVMTWAFDQNPDEGAKLAFGPPATDDVPVMLTCQPKSGVVRISAAVASPHVPPVLRLSSKGVSSSARGRVAEDGLGPRLEAIAPAHLAALAAFADSGQLSVSAGGGGALTATAADPAPVRRFFAACRP